MYSQSYPLEIVVIKLLFALHKSRLTKASINQMHSSRIYDKRVGGEGDEPGWYACFPLEPTSTQCLIDF